MKRTILPLSPALFFVLFAISGFSGLIYESIWTHYLKLFLGHAAYAQTLVLAIFMGGMAGGAWLAARWSNRWRNPLTATPRRGADRPRRGVFPSRLRRRHRRFVSSTSSRRWARPRPRKLGSGCSPRR